MQDTSVRTEHHQSRISRKNLISSLLTGLIIGIFAGAPVGWFSHKVYAQQRAAQVLLCRQQNFGLPEVQLQSRCGNLY